LSTLVDGLHRPDLAFGLLEALALLDARIADILGSVRSESFVFEDRAREATRASGARRILGDPRK
jgi:hypothetical protein